MDVAKVLAGIAKAAPKGGNDIVRIIQAAGAVVSAANILIEQAKPLVGEVDMQAVANRIRVGANGVARSAGEIAKGAGDAAGDAAERAGALFSRLGDAKDELVEGFSQAKSEKELKKAIRDARQAVLENATTAITVADMLKAKEKAGDTGIGPINSMPGCFVIATYRKLDFDKDLTDYIGLYIGRADNVWEGVQKAISREGDPDVYADVKYRQNVHVYVYNCLPEELDALSESLNRTFGD